MPELAHRLAVARGDELADVVIQGGKVFSVFTREWLETDVAICDGYVAGLGEYAGKEVIHAGGKYVVPGFVDAHMHLESSKLLVDEFARLVLPLGTTAVVADPTDGRGLDELREAAGRRVRFRVALQSEVESALMDAFGDPLAAPA